MGVDYFITLLNSAIHFILNLSHESLTIEKEEYDRHVNRAMLSSNTSNLGNSPKLHGTVVRQIKPHHHKKENKNNGDKVYVSGSIIRRNSQRHRYLEKRNS